MPVLRPTVVASKRAWILVSVLTKTAKMPCNSWSIPAGSCQAGKRLLLGNNVCSGWYAPEGGYLWDRVRGAYERR